MQEIKDQNFSVKLSKIIDEFKLEEIYVPNRDILIETVDINRAAYTKTQIRTLQSRLAAKGIVFRLLLCFTANTECIIESRRRIKCHPIVKGKLIVEGEGDLHVPQI